MDYSKILRNVYRTDRYTVGEMGTKNIYNFKEYFMVTGDNSMIKVVDADQGLCYVCVNDSLYPIRLEYPEESISEFNLLYKYVQAYDYCLEELKKMPPKIAKYDPLCKLKADLEAIMIDQDFDAEIALPDSVFEKLDKRCEYLAYAYKKEWDGVINMDTCKRFEDIPSLDSYIKENNLLEKGEGVNKNIRESHLNYINHDGDPLEYIRIPSDSPVGRYVYYGTPLLKNNKLYRMRIQQAVKERAEGLKLARKSLALIQKEKTAPEFARKHLQNRIEKVQGKLLEKSAKIEFFSMT